MRYLKWLGPILLVVLASCGGSDGSGSSSEPTTTVTPTTTLTGEQEITLVFVTRQSQGLVAQNIAGSLCQWNSTTFEITDGQGQALQSGQVETNGIISDDGGDFTCTTTMAVTVDRVPEYQVTASGLDFQANAWDETVDFTYEESGEPVLINVTVP